MIQQAIACDDPVIFFEPKRRYWEKGEVDPTADPPPLHTARVLRRGTTADAGRLRADGADLPRRRGRRGRGRRARPRGDRPAHAVAAATSTRCSTSVRRTGRLVVVAEAPSSVSVSGGGRGPRAGGVLPLPGGAGAAGDRVRHARTRRRGARTTTCRTWTGCWTPSTARWPGDPAMRREFRLPDVGEGLTEAEIVTWRVAPGDAVAVNEVLVEIETAKAAVELPSPFAGHGGGLLVEPGRHGAGRDADHRDRDGRGGAAPTAAAATPRAGRRAGRARSARRARTAGSRRWSATARARVGDPPPAPRRRHRRRRGSAAPRRRHRRARHRGLPRSPCRAAVGRTGRAPATGAAGQAAGPQARPRPRRRPARRRRHRGRRGDHPRRRRAPLGGRRTRHPRARPADARGRRAGGAPGADPRRPQGHRGGHGGQRVHRAARHGVPRRRRHGDDGAARPAAGRPGVRRRRR